MCAQLAFSTSLIRALESDIMSNDSLSEYNLMQRAARAATDLLLQQGCDGQRIAVFCGPGNNGGDGFVMARLLREAWQDVSVYALSDTRQATGAAAQAVADLRLSGATIQSWDDAAIEADLVIDALFGIGLSRPPDSDYARCIAAINNAPDCRVVSVDVPSGLDSDTGWTPGEVVRARQTITFIAPKPGLLMADGPDACGEVTTVPLTREIRRLTARYAAKAIEIDSVEDLPVPRRRRSNSHKSQFGHVLVVAGSRLMPGAARLCAEAALRCGAGLVSVAIDPRHASVVLGGRPEIMLCERDRPHESAVDKADAIVFGPGLEPDATSRRWLQLALAGDRPIVVDATGIDLLREHLPLDKPDLVITPHPGEAARLLGCDSSQVQQDRLAGVEALYEKTGGPVVLKGNGTLTHQGHCVALCRAGNPGMATAGMGDVLSGIIAALIAQGYTPAHAARQGVLLHACAADQAAREGQVGLLASDLFPPLRQMLG